MLPLTTEGMQHVCCFRHALALNERRIKFLPEYVWEGTHMHKPPGRSDARKANEITTEVNEEEETGQRVDIKEVWFAGTHSDV
jgi:hypothetical protein